MSKKIGMIALGCAKNRVDAEVLWECSKNTGMRYVPTLRSAMRA